MSGKLCAVVGVGSGMGQAIARAFAEQGYDLALVSRKAANMEPYRRQVEAAGRRATLHQADVTDRESIQSALDQITRQAGVPQVVVYNVATMTKEKPSQLTAEALIDTLAQNLFGALHTTAAVLPAMRARGSGVLLYTGGGFAIEPSVERTTHSVGKAALRNWVYSLHKELSSEGIHAATVTITRPVEAGTNYDPDFIAGLYVKLALQRPSDWQWEIIHDEL